MTAPSWLSLHRAKDQLSLRLYLLLSAISAAISCPRPITEYTAIHTTLLLIVIASVTLIGCQFFFKKLPINVNIAAFVLGMLWAGHIFVKDLDEDVTNQVTSLLMVLFIGTISFSNNIDAFLLHSVPSSITVLWLSSIEHWLRILYFTALPSIGITFQYIIQKRDDQFTRRLMSKLVEEKKTLSSLSMIDHLTGLYNRRGFENFLVKIQARGEGKHYFLLIDIDHFKLFNDHYGHAMGDQALIAVATAIREAVRWRDVVSRYGGEEFLVMLIDIDCERAVQAAERIRQRVYDLQIDHEYNTAVAPYVTVSIGISSFSDGKTEALVQADKALYEAKHQGRNMCIMKNEIVNNCLKLSLRS